LTDDAIAARGSVEYNCSISETERLETLAQLSVDPECQRMGRTGHDFVRDHFLLTRNLRDYLSILLCLDHPESGEIVV
jgi:hypothetical protein